MSVILWFHDILMKESTHREVWRSNPDIVMKRAKILMENGFRNRITAKLMKLAEESPILPQNSLLRIAI